MIAQELINSGVLEAYVLGQATEQDRVLVERMRLQDASVRNELDEIEAALQAFAMQNAVEPPASVRNIVLTHPAVKAASAAPKAIKEPILLVPEKATTSGSGAWRWLAVASVVGLLLSAGLNVVQYTKLKTAKKELARVEQERSVFAEELNVQRTSLEHSKKQLAILQDPNANVITLQGMGTAAGKTARVYWDKNTAEVHMDFHAVPPPPEGKQYQLWILVDGAPVDAGVIPLNDADGIERMKDVKAGQTFAVTIEKMGGSEGPDLASLVYMGQV